MFSKFLGCDEMYLGIDVLLSYLTICKSIKEKQYDYIICLNKKNNDVNITFKDIFPDKADYHFVLVKLAKDVL